MSNVVFILGAGFNVDASATVPHQGRVSYPLVGDLLRECFDQPPSEKSVEELFQEALDKGDAEPVRRLAHMLQKADYYLSEQAPNSYSAFLEAFPAAPILTFNYDGLIEILLLRKGLWRPEDGFGVKVEVRLPSSYISPITLPVRSDRQILHLHGSLYLQARELEIVPRGLGTTDLLRLRSEPQFIFDPDSVTHRFPPFVRPTTDLLYTHPHERVIAPVPQKSEGQKGAFFNCIYERACNLLAEASMAVVIGYSFSRHDVDSYEKLLQALSGRATVALVTPDAISLADRLGSTWQSVKWLPIPQTFAQWADSCFEGVL